jgi:hypothetical protein
MQQLERDRQLKKGSLVLAGLIVAIVVTTTVGFPLKGQTCGAPNPPPCDLDPTTGTCGTGGSPIIIDVEGEGFHLTSAAVGVVFDISGTGHPIQIAWTDANFHNAFLALPGPDGQVHSGKELFGNFTPQPPSAHPNGFLALAQFDKPENGGNGDGVIDARDQVFSSLRLWIDANHDGIAQPEELFKLPERGVVSISLKYRESRRMDRFGNEFRYRGRINATEQQEDQSQADPIVYDVFFVAATEISRRRSQ